MTTRAYGDTLRPHDYPEMFATVILDGLVSPGKVTLSGHDRDQDWDVQKAKGKSGASSKYTGSPIGQFQATFHLADSDDIENWPAFQTRIESSTDGPEPIALPIFHPDLAANGFTEVVNGGVGGIVWDDQGGALVQVKFLEYKPPKDKPAGGARGKGGGGSSGNGAGVGGGAGGGTSDPNQEAKDELADLWEGFDDP